MNIKPGEITDILKREINAIAPHAKWHKDWKAELRERLEITFERLDTMTSIEAFNALLRSGLAVSDADWEFTKRLERDVLDGHFIAFENEVRAACKSGFEFKVYDNRVIYSHEQDYEAIEAERWNGYEWLQEYGKWPGEEAKEHEPGDDISDSLIADATHHRDDEEELVDNGGGPVLPPQASAEHPADEDFPPPETADVDRLDDRSQQPATLDAAPGIVAAPDCNEAPPTLPDDRPHGIDGLVGDDFDDEDPDDYDWHDENPDLDLLNLDLDPELQDAFASSDRPSDASAEEGPTGPPEQPELGDVPPKAISLPDDQAANRPPKPRTYRPHTDYEEDDWNE